MTQNDVQAELEYLKTLAENGARAPSIGGRFALWWGTLTAIVLSLHWAIITGVLSSIGLPLLGLWLGYIVIGSIGSFVLGQSLRNKPGIGSAGNRHANAVWSAMGFAVMAFFFAILMSVLLGRLEPVMFNLMLPVALMGYGIGWISSAVMNRSLGDLVPGLVDLAGMAACLLFLTDPIVYLIAAITVFLSASIPGAIQVAREPKSVV